MLEMITHSGLVGLVLLAIALTCVVLFVKAFLRRRSGNAAALASSRQALLFWGVLAVLLGFVGHTAGVFNALSVIVDAETVSGAEVASALRVSLYSVILGLGVLAIATTGWLALGLVSAKVRT